MFCSGCGQTLASGEMICARCGRPVAMAPAGIPAINYSIDQYASRVRTLGIVWLVYSGLSLFVGLLGLAFAHAVINGSAMPWMGPGWMHGVWGARMHTPFSLHFAMTMIFLRAVLAFFAGWGLLERSEWGRVVALVAAFVCLLRIPLGTGLGIWTMVTLLGTRNAVLYDQL